jgi:Trypsin-co-occurring domain 2
MHQIPLAEAIQQLRDELREAMLEVEGQDIIFTPENIELELGVSFGTEEKAGGGFKLLAFLDLSVEGKAKQESQHKIKLSLGVTDGIGQPLKVRSREKRKGVPPS